jgi:hypothetical protein
MMTAKILVFALLMGFMLIGHEGKVTSMDPQDPDRGPAVSTPKEHVAPNGDLVSPYPPYFRPDSSRR